MSLIRTITPADLDALKAVIESTGLFPPELLDNMTAAYFSATPTDDVWLTYEENGTPVAVAYYAPERMTEGTYNLYLIAVHSDRQGKRIGAALLIHIENTLREEGARILIIETSGLPEFESSRKFYDRCGYTREAVIREFYAEGDDKVVFWKKL